MITWFRPKYEKGIDIEVKEINTRNGLMYDIFLSNPYVGKKRVRRVGERFLKMRGLVNEHFLEEWVYSHINYYLNVYFSGEEDTNDYNYG